MSVKKEKRMVFFVFSVIFASIGWKFYLSLATYLFWTISLILLALIIFSPMTLHPLLKLWLKVAHAIGRFNTQVLLCIMFFLVFLPLGLLMRLFKYDPLKIKQRSDETYWEDYELVGVKDKNRYEKQF